MSRPPSFIKPSNNQQTSPRVSHSSLLPPSLPKDSSQDSQATQLAPTTINSSTPPPPPHFAPFFTLIEDVHSPDHHHHPTVHYIFSDDDTDLIADACLQIYHDKNTATNPPSNKNSPQPPSPTITNRYITLSLSPSLTSLTTATSLTSDWAVLNARISTAPTLHGGSGTSEENEEGGRGMMLKIEGTEGPKGVVEEERAGRLGVEGLMEEFGRNMEELKRVVEWGERRGEGRVGWRDKALGEEQEEREEGQG